MDDSDGSNVFELESTDDGEFYQAVRHAIMAMLVTVVLYMISYVILCRFKRPHISNTSSEDLTEASVYRITISLCSFTLSVSLAASLLLPTSIISRELVRHWPSSYYIKWINGKLIRELWNSVFLCSNLSLFVLLPFSYFFLESEGFSGTKGIVGRIKETLTVLVLLSFVTFGCSLLLSKLITSDHTPLTFTLVFSTLFSEKIIKSPWFMYSYLYSMTSFLGVAVLLVCTPLGLARIFTVIGGIVMKPQLSTSLDEQINILDLEKGWIERNVRSNGLSKEELSVRCVRLTEIKESLVSLRERKAMSPWRRNTVYPCVLLLLLFVTALSVFMVILNILKLLLGYGPLPGLDESFDKEFLDSKYDSYMGSLRAVVEIGLVCYILIASLVGFYTKDNLRWLIPKPKDTSVTTIIINCVVFLVMSCSLPLLSATLGLTRFDLLGHYRTVEWLKNVHVILVYNITFVVLSALCLVKKVTTAILREVYNQLQPPARIRHKFYLHVTALCSIVGALRPRTS